MYFWACASVLLICTTISNCQIQSFCKPTSPDTEGPYWMNNAPVKNTTLCDTMIIGNTLVISGRITDENCRQGLPAMMDVWQANEKGEYSDGKFNFACRARIMTDPQGYYRYATIFPAKYMQNSGYRPAHIHYKVEAMEGGYGVFITQMYFKNDTSLGPNDSCNTDGSGGGCNSGDPTRYIDPKLSSDHLSYEATFNIVLKKQWRKIRV